MFDNDKKLSKFTKDEMESDTSTVILRRLSNVALQRLAHATPKKPAPGESAASLLGGGGDFMLRAARHLQAQYTT